MIESHAIWHLAGMSLVIALFTIRRWISSTNIVLICLVALPGVVLHEICHLAAGIIFRAAPTGFNLIPERTSRGWALGSVEFGRVTAFNAVPIALAPLTLLFLAYEVFLHWGLIFPSTTLLSTLGLYTVVFTLSYESIPSRQDIRVATNWRSLLLYGSVVGVFIVWKYGAHL